VGKRELFYAGRIFPDSWVKKRSPNESEGCLGLLSFSTGSAVPASKGKTMGISSRMIREEVSFEEVEVGRVIVRQEQERSF
jgi:hypothetical protein